MKHLHTTRASTLLAAPPSSEAVREAIRRLELRAEQRGAMAHAGQRANVRRFCAVPEPITGWGGLSA